MSEPIVNTAAGLAAVVQILVKAGITTDEEVNQLRGAITAEWDQQQAAARDRLLAENPGLATLLQLAGGGGSLPPTPNPGALET